MVAWSNVFCLFSGQYREIRYAQSLLECVWVVQIIAILDHVFFFELTKVLDRWEDLRHSLEMPKVKSFMSLR